MDGTSSSATISSKSSSTSISSTPDFWTWRQTAKLVLIGCALSFITNFPSSFLHTSVNTAVEALDTYVNGSYIDRQVEIDENQHTMVKALINNCWFVGQFIGALFSPRITDKFGRKPAYLLATAVMTFACFLQMIASIIPYPEILIVGRTMAAMFSPMSDAVAILFLQEISPIHLRGALSSLFATGYSAMALLGLILGTDSVLGHSLCLLLFVPVIPGLLSLVFLAWLPETPKFLMISKKNAEAAERSLCFYQGYSPRNELTLTEYQFESNESVESTKASMWDLFLVPYLRQAMLLTFMVLTLCLPFYPILQCSTTFLRLMQIDDNLSQYFSSLIGVLMIVGCLLAPFLLKKFKRRSLVLWLGWASTAFILMFAICGWLADTLEWAKYGGLIGLLGYIVCWSVSVGPISYFIGPELVPLQYRSSIFCICYALNNIFIFVTNFLALALFRHLGASCFVPLFVLPSTIALIYIHLYLPETKNKETHVIVAMLKAGRRKIDPKPELVVNKL
ncbi:Solute carrier family 2, facilitated glucose transporter member 3 [Aphelenchoides bicaudatus]|nr:Solute carrier family 2, facilitated glucose transporter member 3 [Aphelenchoides bicaudatus]